MILGPYYNPVDRVRRRYRIIIAAITLIYCISFIWTNKYSYSMGKEDMIIEMWREELQITEEELRRME